MQGQTKCKSTARANFASQPNTATVQFHDAPGEGQAQTRALLLPGVGVIHLFKSAKDSILMLRRNADAGILHRYEQLGSWRQFPRRENKLGR